MTSLQYLTVFHLSSKHKRIPLSPDRFFSQITGVVTIENVVGLIRIAEVALLQPIFHPDH